MDPKTPPTPGGREHGMLTTFGVPATSLRVVPIGPSTMDAATIAARQREGGGAPDQRRPVRRESRWPALRAALSWILDA
jgi:hypothetical protein